MLVKTQYDLEIDKILENANIDFDTFKEISDVILQLQQDITLLQGSLGSIEDFEASIAN